MPRQYPADNSQYVRDYLRHHASVIVQQEQQGSDRQEATLDNNTSTSTVPKVFTAKIAQQEQQEIGRQEATRYKNTSTTDTQSPHCF